jgi:uncharacterized protein DUF2490
VIDNAEAVTRTMGRIVRILGLVATLNFTAGAQERSETRKEIWPEVDVYVTLTNKFRPLFISSLTRAEETRDNLEASVQGSLDYIPSRHASIRVAYRYAFSPPSQERFKEHRILIEQTFRKPIFWDVLVSDRNREEIRDVNHQTSFRYRNRVTLEREFQLGKRKLAPYLSGELYYDSRFDTWNRNRLNLGVQIPLRRGFPLVRLLEPRRQMVLDFYYMDQNDSRSKPAHITGFGFAYSSTFDILDSGGDVFTSKHLRIVPLSRRGFLRY